MSRYLVASLWCLLGSLCLGLSDSPEVAFVFAAIASRLAWWHGKTMETANEAR